MIEGPGSARVRRTPMVVSTLGRAYARFAVKMHPVPVGQERPLANGWCHAFRLCALLAPVVRSGGNDAHMPCATRA